MCICHSWSSGNTTLMAERLQSNYFQLYNWCPTMKKLTIAFTLAISLLTIGCNEERYDANTMTAIQPCLQMGYQPSQCVASYRQFGNSDNQWLDNVAAFAAGAVANHWWNRYQQPSYNYNPNYWDTHPRVTNRTITNNYTINQYDTKPLNQQSKPLPNIIQPIPEKNTQKLIPNQQVQPLFKPNTIVPNSTPKPTPSFTPPPTPTFKPIQVAPSIRTEKATNTPTFKPISISRPSSSFKSSSSKR